MLVRLLCTVAFGIKLEVAACLGVRKTVFDNRREGRRTYRAMEM